MTGYYWTTPITMLREDRIISRVLEQGLRSEGFKTLGDLKDGKSRLESKFLRRQAAFLYNFLQTIIDCDRHNYTVDELIVRLPSHLVKSFEYAYNKVCNDPASRTIVEEVFRTSTDCLFALLVDKADIWKSGYYHFGRRADFDCFRDAIASLVQDLIFLCECFPDCYYYGRYLKGIMVETVGHYEALGMKSRLRPTQIGNIDKRTDYNALDSIFSKTLAHYAVRTRNVLLHNGITSINDFKPWMEDRGKEFMPLKGCGRKSAMELGQFREELLAVLSNTESRNDTSRPDCTNLLEDAVDTWNNHDARHSILKLFGSSRAFVASFFLSPQNTFGRLSSAKGQFELLTSVIGLVASVIVTNQNEGVTDSMVKPLKSLKRLFKADSRKMLADSLMTGDKKILILAEFNRRASALSLRSRNALLRMVNAGDPDSVVAFLISDHSFTSMDKIGQKSNVELKGFTSQMGEFFAKVLSKEDDKAKYAAVIEDFPFLNTVDAEFVYNFKTSTGHYPMFFVAWKYFTFSVTRAGKLYRDYYGMGFTDFASLDELANEYHLTKERVRQIVTFPQKQSHYDKNPLLMEEQWKAYPFIYSDIVTESSSDFSSLASEEHLGLSFFSFCGIVNFISPKIIEKVKGDLGKSMTVAFTTALRRFKLHSALREIVRIRDTGKDSDMRISLLGHIAGNGKYWTRNIHLETSKTALACKLLSEIIHELDMANMDENGNLLLKANKPNYSDVIYGILNEHGEPMHIDEILAAFRQKLPQDKHDTLTAMRYFMKRDERIEPIGKTSTYKLTAWNVYSGSIPRLLVEILLAHNTPIETSQLVEEALRYRNTSTKRSIESNIKQKVADGALTMYYPNLVGLSGKSYDAKYKIVPGNFEEYLNAFVDFVEENERFPVLTNLGYESLLYRWYKDPKTLLSFTDQEIIRFSETIKMLNERHYAQGMKEYNFLTKCKQYRRFVSATGRMLTDKDDKPLASWFMKSAMQYQSWNDNRAYYFKDLLLFISKTV